MFNEKNFTTKNKKFPENFSIEELRDKIKSLGYDELSSKGILQKAHKNGYICPACGNGEGENGTGIEEHRENNGVVTSYCHKCSESFDNIKILALYYRLSATSDFKEIIKRGAYDLLNIEVDFDAARHNEGDEKEIYRELILKDIEESQKNLSAFVESQGGKWRGLTLETLLHFFCGYIAEWIHPIHRMAGKNIPPSRRVIIPNNQVNYNSIALNEDRPNLPKNTWKLSAGNKDIFGIDLLPLNSELIIVVEGEVDAMSIYQATGGEFDVIATGGAAIKTFIKTLADYFTNVIKLPRILILFDNDKAGKKNAEKNCARLIDRDFAAVAKYLANGSEKVDANDILTKQGDDKLTEIINRIIVESQADFEEAERIIEENKKVNDSEAEGFIMTDDLRRKIYFPGGTDSDNGKRLAALFSDKVKFLTDENKWAFYLGDVWEIHNSGSNKDVVHCTMAAADIISANALTQEEKKKATAFKFFKTASPAITYFRGIKSVKITRKDFDNHKMLLPVANGVIDLTTGERLDYTPELYLTKKCPVEYKGKDYQSKLFDDFMQSILPDEQTRRAVLRYLGYCLTGKVSEEKALFILGNGRNGKGTLMKILLTLLDNYATSIRIEAFLQQKFKDGNSATPEFAKLDGCRLAVANEIPQNEKLDVAKFKDLTGGDKFSARKLHAEPVLIEPTHKLIFCGQYLPEIFNANDIGYNERLLVAKFPQQFTGDKCDPHLKDKLLEGDVLSGVLSTLVNECLAWQNEGLIVSDAMQAEKQSYFDDNNFIADFISEYCEVGEGKTCYRKELLDTLKDKYKTASRLSDNALSDMIKKELTRLEIKFEDKKVKKGKIFIGIELSTDREQKIDFEGITKETLQNHSAPEPPPTDEMDEMDENIDEMFDFK